MEDKAIILLYWLKWTLFAITTGIVVGGGVAVFLTVLAWAIKEWSEVGGYYFFLPVILALNCWLVGLFAVQTTGGSNKVIEAIHQQYGYLRLRELPLKMLATVITIAAGGSAGKEGPAAQLGATLASAWARLLKVSRADCRKLVICGLSAGFACVFGTPVAGAIFGIEVLYIGKIAYDTLYPGLVAGMTGFYVCRLMGMHYFYLPIPVELSLYLGIQSLLLGSVCGLLAIFFIYAINFWKKVFSGIPLVQPAKAFIGGIMLVMIGHFVSPLYLGLGMQLLEAGISGQTLAVSAFFWKTVATGITLGCGGSGGIILPVMIAGTAAGNLFGQVCGNVDMPVYAILGMAALLAAAANVPVATIVMVAELFGGDIMPYAAVSCSVSYLLSGHRSVYPSQVIIAGKISCLCYDEGKTVGEDRRPGDIEKEIEGGKIGKASG
jgi:H+/Cl- antiporter ClcA